MYTLGTGRVEQELPTYLWAETVDGQKDLGLESPPALIIFIPPGKKSLNILWNPDLIPGDECFTFETQASALRSPTEKDTRRAVVKPTRATSPTQSLA